MFGSVSPGGSLSYKMSVKTADLPAQCSLAADRGSTQTFTVTEDSPGKWWFHIQQDGQVTGPGGRNDVFTNTRQTQEINVTVPSGPVIR